MVYFFFTHDPNFLNDMNNKSCERKHSLTMCKCYAGVTLVKCTCSLYMYNVNCCILNDSYCNSFS